eukprot:3153874-Amphidinium_carterae.3
MELDEEAGPKEPSSEPKARTLKTPMAGPMPIPSPEEMARHNMTHLPYNHGAQRTGLNHWLLKCHSSTYSLCCEVTYLQGMGHQAYSIGFTVMLRIPYMPWQKPQQRSLVKTGHRSTDKTTCIAGGVERYHQELLVASRAMRHELERNKPAQKAAIRSYARCTNYRDKRAQEQLYGRPYCGVINGFGEDVLAREPAAAVELSEHSERTRDEMHPKARASGSCVPRVPEADPVRRNDASWSKRVGPKPLPNERCTWGLQSVGLDVQRGWKNSKSHEKSSEEIVARAAEGRAQKRLWQELLMHHQEQKHQLG